LSPLLPCAVIALTHGWSSSGRSTSTVIGVNANGFVVRRTFRFVVV